MSPVTLHQRTSHLKKTITGPLLAKWWICSLSGKEIKKNKNGLINGRGQREDRKSNIWLHVWTLYVLISLERIHVSASAVKNMFVLVSAVGVDLGFVAVAVVIYCSTKTSCAADFKFRVFPLNRCISVANWGDQNAFPTHFNRKWNKKIPALEGFFFPGWCRLGLVLVEENYCESNVRVMMRSALWSSVCVWCVT